MKNKTPVPQPTPFALSRLLRFTVIWSLALLGLHFLFFSLRYKFHLNFDYGEHWPISLAYRNVTPLYTRIGIGAVLLGVFAGMLPWLRRGSFGLRRALPAACVLLLGTTGLQGYERGFIMPTMALENRTQQYFDDAVKIENTRTFLASYNANQTRLTNHAQTHPPGAVLAYYYLFLLFLQPALISVVIGIFSLAAGMIAIDWLVRKEFGAPLAGLAAFLYALLPGVQIYSLASLDGLIAAFFILTVACYLSENRWLGYLGTVICIFCAMMLTYAFLFLPVVFLVYELFARKSFARFCSVVLGLMLMLVLLDGVFKFNYLQGFRTASRIENPAGFMLFADPLTYVATRLEDVCEILLFLGPVLGWLLFAGLGALDRYGERTPRLVLFSRAAVATLLLMFLTGAFRTGETARSGLFITPFLIFPIAARMDQLTPDPTATSWTTAILACAFLQTVFMQFVGFYFW